jgi:hypothetical protein
MKTIKQILIERDGIEPEEADELIESAKQDLMLMIEAGDLFGAEDVMQNHFGLESDYMDELIGFCI